MADSKELGKRIKKFRERLELSQEQLATNAGMDVGLVAAIEGGDAYPAIGVLVKLSRALGQRLGTFLDDHIQNDPLVVRSAARVADVSPHKGKVASPYTYYSLARGKSDRHMEPMFVEIGPEQEEKFSSHEGEEFIIVVSGEILLKYGKKTEVLKPGDTAYYNSIVPHFVGANGGKSAAIYAVIFQPL